MGSLFVNIIVNYWCMCVLRYANILKQTETEETNHFCYLFLVGDISIGGSLGPLATPMMH